MMKPSVFLKLAKPISYINDKKIEGLKKFMEDGGKIASPFLYVALKDNKGKLTGKDASIKTHEGRHRMIAVKDLYGDKPIEVHLFFSYDLRARHLNEGILKDLNSGMFNEDGQYVLGPLFEVKNG